MNRLTNLSDTILSQSSFVRQQGNYVPPPPPPPPPPGLQGPAFIQPKIVIAQNPHSFRIDDYIKYRYPFKYTILHVAALVFLNVVVITLEVVLTLKNTAAANVYGNLKNLIQKSINYF
jgi:hypothetical protein